MSSSVQNVEPAILGSPSEIERPRVAVATVTRQRRTHRGTWYSLLAGIERAADVLAASIGTIAAQIFYRTLGIGHHVHYSESAVVFASLAAGCAFMVLYDLNGGYDQSNSLLQIRETERVLRASVQTLGLAMAVVFLATYLVSRWTALFALFLIPITVLAEKLLIQAGVRWLHEAGFGVERVAVYGAGDTSRRLVSALLRSPRLGLNPVVVIDDNAATISPVMQTFGYTHDRAVPVVAGPIDPQSLVAQGISTVIVAIPSLAPEKFDCITAELEAAGIHVSFVPRMTTAPGHSVSYIHVDGLVIGSHLKKHSTWSMLAKRVLDLSLASLGLLLVSPAWLLIALWVKLDSKGPVLFSQMRVGKDGRLFRMYKFRTMFTDAPQYEYSPKSSIDPRITRAGRILRRTSIDELPQILNVITGQMSLVGPRPEMPFIVDTYTTYHRQRLEVAPGITGLWQLSADRASLIHENMNYDLYYIRSRTFFMDVAILLHTVVFAIRGV